MNAKNIIDLIGLGDTVGAKNAIEETIQSKVAEKLENMKLDLINKTFNEASDYEEEDEDEIEDDEDEEDDEEEIEESLESRRAAAKEAAIRARKKAEQRKSEKRQDYSDKKKVDESEEVEESYGRGSSGHVAKIIAARRARERIARQHKVAIADHQRAIKAAKASAEANKVSENSQIDELSNKTLSSYIKKATDREEEEHTRGLNKATARIIKNRLADKGAARTEAEKSIKNEDTQLDELKVPGKIKTAIYKKKYGVTPREAAKNAKKTATSEKAAGKHTPPMPDGAKGSPQKMTQNQRLKADYRKTKSEYLPGHAPSRAELKYGSPGSH